MSKKETSISIIQVPTDVRFECPHCLDDIEMDYDEFERIVGCSVQDWNYSFFCCPECGEDIMIDSVEWD